MVMVDLHISFKIVAVIQVDQSNHLTKFYLLGSNNCSNSIELIQQLLLSSRNKQTCLFL